jgi:hypothetical protein
MKFLNSLQLILEQELGTEKSTNDLKNFKEINIIKHLF